MYKKCAVILAGGKGTRLRPYTIAMPKPLVPVGDYPILEIIIRQLAQNGFGKIIITVNHQAELIKAYFGDGSRWNIEIIYSMENKPLGTMGPLKNIIDLPDDFIVMNGDVLTDLNYGSFLDKHINENRIFTISGFSRQHKVDYGVLHLDNNKELIGFEEKPKLNYIVSMGVYAVSKKVLSYIPVNEFYGFDILMKDLMLDKQKVKVDVYNGYWLDIGRPSDYEKAIEDFSSEKGKFLNEDSCNRS